MNYERFRETAEMVGIFGIIASLALVAYELRQSSAIARAEAAFQINTSLDTAYRMRAQDATLAQLIKKGHEDPKALTAVEDEQFFIWLHADLNTSEALWFYYKNGLIPDVDFDGFSFSICSRLVTNGGKEYWRRRSEYFAPGFREFVDTTCYPDVVVSKLGPLE